MKAAVVVGSVLTVACLAAVFGVTILANEVSKEVKVSNGVLSNKAGNTVVTASSVATQADSTGAHRATISQNGVEVSAAVNAVVSVANGKMYFCDDMIVNGAEVMFFKDSVLANIVGAGEVASRSLSCPPCFWFAAQVGWTVVRYLVRTYGMAALTFAYNSFKAGMVAGALDAVADRFL
ncbi:MAG: hypothetical protein GY811_10245 [Myxococcales bacterium]|nr:hypothetical protein [Myxococcales bacterium]